MITNLVLQHWELVQRRWSFCHTHFIEATAHPSRPQYQGSCKISGVGYGEHTFTMINSPCAFLCPLAAQVLSDAFADKPGTLYFTGVHYTNTDDGKEQPWSDPVVAGCCAEYTFPDGAVTTIASSSASASASTSSVIASSTGNSTTTAESSDEYVTIITVSYALDSVCLRWRESDSLGAGQDGRPCPCCARSFTCRVHQAYVRSSDMI